jgi:hypothetical protein
VICLRETLLYAVYNHYCVSTCGCKQEVLTVRASDGNLEGLAVGIGWANVLAKVCASGGLFWQRVESTFGDEDGIRVGASGSRIWEGSRWM